MASGRAASTILDVAARAGVSRQTVTRALNDMADVSPATRDRVIAAARELNYRPNRSAQSMVRGRTTTIGLVLEDLANPYFAELASAFSNVAAERDWNVLLCNVGVDREKGRAHLASIVSRVDALAMTGCRTDTYSLLPEGMLSERGFGVPLVMLDGPAHPRLSARVVLDVEASLLEALDRLVAAGRRRVAFIDSAVGPNERRDLFASYIQRNDLEWQGRPELSVEETSDAGAAAAEQALRRAPDLDALVVYNDVMAAGVLKALQRLGRRVPEDVAVIGMDGLEIGRLVTPELTTLAIDKDELARVAIGLLAEALDHPFDRDAREVVLEMRLLTRGSSGTS